MLVKKRKLTLKEEIHDFILVVVTIIVLVAVVFSIGYMLRDGLSWKNAVVCAISALWLSLLTYANRNINYIP